MNNIKEHAHNLEDHIKTLRELDRYRKESAALREGSFKALDKECPPIETEAQPTEVKGRGKTAVKEFVQWWWIDAWEKEARNLRNYSNVILRSIIAS